MIVDIGAEAAQFRFWEHLSQIFGINYQKRQPCAWTCQRNVYFRQYVYFIQIPRQTLTLTPLLQWRFRIYLHSNTYRVSKFWSAGCLFRCIDFWIVFYVLPPNSHISTPFFHKTAFFSKIFFGKPPSKLLEVCLNSVYMWKWSPVYNFNRARVKLISSGVEVTSTLPNSHTQKDLLM